MRARLLAAGGDSALAPDETSARLRDQRHDLTVAARQRVGSGRSANPTGRRAVSGIKLQIRSHK
ncbi:hypothetical protein [Methylobacterium flocculans]|uniref:hypothetical protein n=1 Tax=Methylobacterium flocculans TaxID=2984843 RepID=UPI0021F322C9|nr:hypothetical protein [Methylobacterium sp. FF17]